MNERAIVDALKKAYPIKEGSTPREITPIQQRVAHILGDLLNHAYKRGKRKAGRWVE